MYFKQAYEAVFDADNNVKLCGREACKTLIALCDKYEPNVSHGNIANGVLDIEAVRHCGRAILGDNRNEVNE